MALERAATKAVIMRLVEKVRRMRNWYHKVDAKAFSPDGYDPNKLCGKAHCPENKIRTHR